MPQRLNHVGVDQFIQGRTKLLNDYDHAKANTVDDAVKTSHGVEGEAEIRKWLKSFLPKRFGVCKGHIITTNKSYDGPLEQWDVIVYDALDSPILFTRGPNDSEELQAIPVEYVRAVIEVKATLTPESARKCTSKLLKLNAFIGVERSFEYPEYLDGSFVCAAVFFETKVATFAQYRSALDTLAELYQVAGLGIPFIGALVLRSQSNAAHSGYIRLLWSEENHPMPDWFEHSTQFTLPDGKYGMVGSQFWSVINYQYFLFDFLAYLRGTKSQRVSSFYGLDFENSRGSSRLFDWNELH